jgi:uncharacterized protein YdeI (BOF family)
MRILAMIALLTSPALAGERCDYMQDFAVSTMRAQNVGATEQEMLSVVDSASAVYKEIVQLAATLPVDADPQDFGRDIRAVCEGSRRGN